MISTYGFRIFPTDSLNFGRIRETMKGGRKNLKRAADEKMVTLQQDQSIMQVVDLRGSNLIEVMDANGHKLLAIFPAKFQKSMWMKRGNFVVIDESGREEAVESGRKVAGMVIQVLYHEQLRLLQKSPEWPTIFKTISQDNTNLGMMPCTSQQDVEENSSDDEGLPPLEANTNRRNPFLSRLDGEAESELESESESDTDTELLLLTQI